MKNIIKNILKEEHDQKLERTIYSYIDKKIDTGKWYIIKNPKFYLLISESGSVLFVYNRKKRHLFFYKESYNKFTRNLNIDYEDYSNIIKKYIQDKLDEKINRITYIGLSIDNDNDLRNLYEEYGNKNEKLKDFIYNYFDKKINSGEWRWVKLGNDDLILLDKDNLVLLKYTILSQNLWYFRDIFDKFIMDFRFKKGEIQNIVKKYFKDKFNLKVKYIEHLSIDMHYQPRDLTEQYNKKSYNLFKNIFDRKINSGKWYFKEIKSGDFALYSTSHKLPMMLVYDEGETILIYSMLGAYLINDLSFSRNEVENFIIKYVNNRFNFSPNQTWINISTAR